ncbi:hypothetical protein H8356DRAFT_1051481 [Neocallimastix lanati (nom. inval.)]|nr:hypothetical protein H8356DRAFT_1051481 [Neocallimastix sp. JGI-2020a]
MQSQTISVPVVISSQVNMALGKYSQQKSSMKPSTITTTTTSYVSSPVRTIYRNYNNSNNQTVFMSMSSSSSKKTTTTTTRISNNKSKNSNSNDIATSAFIIGTSHSSKKNSFDVPFLVSLFSISFKYIFIITANVFDKLLFIVLNPVETLICIYYKISEIRAMNHQIKELKHEKAQLITQSDQLMVQLNASRFINRTIENSYKVMKQKRDLLKETNKALQNELQRERESRYVVEKCHNERIEKLEFEIDMKDQELMQNEDKERLLKKKIHKLQKKLKKVVASSSSSSNYPTSFSILNYNSFSFDDPVPSNDEPNMETNLHSEKESKEISDFAKDSDVEFCNDSNSADEWDTESETESEAETDNSVTNVIPKNSIYYNIGRRQNNGKEEEDEEEEIELKSKMEQNPISIIRQEAYNCLYQSFISELSASSILMDLDVKLDKNNLSSYVCINTILEAIINYLETRNLLTNMNAIDEIFYRYRPLILNYIDTKEDQMNVLVSLENICIENSLRLQQHLRILMAIYKAEIVDPNVIIKWYHLLPDSEESNHGACPMTPSLHCVLPKILSNNMKMYPKSYSFSEGDYKSYGHMIDGHYATKAFPISLNDNATINVKSEGSAIVNHNAKIDMKALPDDHIHTEEPVENTSNNKAVVNSKNKNKNGGGHGHTRTSSGSLIRRKRSLSNASDSGHEVYYLRLRKDVRELAKVFALWLESKESSSEDEESILDNMSMSQDLETDSEDSGIGKELRRLHRKLLSDEDTCDTNSNSNNSYGMEDDELSENGSIASYSSNHSNLSGSGLKKNCKRVTFNLSHLEDKDEDETINNDEEEVNQPDIKLEDSPLFACLERNPLSFNQFEFDEDVNDNDNENTDEENEEEEEEIIEEVEEVIEEEEIIEEELIEETINGNEENGNEDDESVTIVEEKEEIIDEVVECVKVNC